MHQALVVSILFLLSTITTIFLVLRKPSVSIPLWGKRRFTLDTFFLPGLFTALLLLLTGLLSFPDAWTILRGDDRLSPIGILALFFSMVFISIFLDSCGFFEYCARLAVRRAHNSGTRLFFILYGVISLLTVFTSNDIIILTFTPFIYYFTKATSADPLPFLLAEFFAANTWSTVLYIGNPTNIVVASAMGIGFLDFTKWMLLPTIAAGLVTIGVLYLLFRKRLETKKKEHLDPKEALRDKAGAIFGLSVLILCIVVLSFTPTLGFTMWEVSIWAAVVLLAFILLRIAYNHLEAHHEKRRALHPHLHAAAMRLPWAIAPFLLSLFILVGALSAQGVPYEAGRLLMRLSGGSTLLAVLLFGVASVLVANVINNIPMSVAFVYVLAAVPAALAVPASYAVIMGSNLGANLTPIGALAGIMWMSILKDYGFHVSFKQFMKYGALVTAAALLASLLVIALEFAAWA